MKAIRFSYHRVEAGQAVVSELALRKYKSAS